MLVESDELPNKTAKLLEPSCLSKTQKFTKSKQKSGQERHKFNQSKKSSKKGT